MCHSVLTVSFDHNVIDGAPAARFTQRLKELIESGYGLEDFIVEPMPACKDQTVSLKGMDEF